MLSFRVLYILIVDQDFAFDLRQEKRIAYSRLQWKICKSCFSLEFDFKTKTSENDTEYGAGELQYCDKWSNPSIRPASSTTSYT